MKRMFITAPGVAPLGGLVDYPGVQTLLVHNARAFAYPRRRQDGDFYRNCTDKFSLRAWSTMGGSGHAWIRLQIKLNHRPQLW
jgi:hypothetical protein